MFSVIRVEVSAVKCDRCKVNPATIQVTTVQDGKKVQSFLCSQCAAETSHSHVSNPFDDFFKSILDVPKSSEYQKVINQVTCPMCKTTYNEFKKNGKAGCGHCYKVFEDSMAYILKQIHGTTDHVGKLPEVAGEAMKKKKNLQTLKQRLQEAIQTEAFEEAAQLRDEIRALEKGE